jgi:hypothetical protein
VRSVTSRILLPLTFLVAAPLLGWSGRAQAGYVTPVSAVAATHSDSLADGGPQMGMDGMGASSADSNSGDPQLLERQSLKTTAPGSLAFLTTFGTPSTGAGAPPAPNGPGAGGVNSQTTVAARPQVDPPTLVGVLFLEEVTRRLPPFPSRLFRPPRYACA